jgi:hypothetical protein
MDRNGSPESFQYPTSEAHPRVLEQESCRRAPIGPTRS